MELLDLGLNDHDRRRIQVERVEKGGETWIGRKISVKGGTCGGTTKTMSSIDQSPLVPSSPGESRGWWSLQSVISPLPVRQQRNRDFLLTSVGRGRFRWRVIYLCGFGSLIVEGLF